MQGNIDTAELTHRLEQRMNMKPDYDSGWVAIAQDTEATITHSLGGDEDKYFIDLQMQDTTGGGVGKSMVFYSDSDDNGMCWYNLTSTSIKIYNSSASAFEKYRLRIWKNQYQ